MRRIIPIACILLACLTLSGCLPSTALKRRAVVQALGVDLEDGEYQVTMQIFDPAGGGGQGTFDSSQLNNRVIECRGDTITDALYNSAQTFGKQVFLGNNRLIIVGEEAACTGLQYLIDFFNANHETRPKTLVLIADGKASDVVSAQVNEGIVPANSIELALENTRRSGLSAEGYLMDLADALVRPGASPFAPVIRITESVAGEPLAQVNGTAVFQGDRLAERLDPTQTRGMLWVRDEIDQTAMTVEYPDWGRVALNVHASKTDIRSSIVQGVPNFVVEVKAKSSINEVVQEKGDEILLKDLEQIQKLQEAQIRKEIYLAVETALKENRTDVFRFCDILRKYQPEYWKQHGEDWGELMDQSVVEIQVTCTIDRVGLESKLPRQ